MVHHTLAQYRTSHHTLGQYRTWFEMRKVSTGWCNHTLMAVPDMERDRVGEYRSDRGIRRRLGCWRTGWCTALRRNIPSFSTAQRLHTLAQYRTARRKPVAYCPVVQYITAGVRPRSVQRSKCTGRQQDALGQYKVGGWGTALHTTIPSLSTAESVPPDALAQYRIPHMSVPGSA
eukprot:3605813-Rhodomonas_salina.3